MSHATPLAGDKPQPYISPSTLGCRCSGHSGWCRRPVPAGTGTPRYDNWMHWLIEGFSGRLCPTPLPWLGTSPSPTSFLRPSAVVVRATVVGVAGRCRNLSRIEARDTLSYQAQSFRLATISSMAARMVRVLSRDSGNS